MTKKDECKRLMGELFGPASANQVDKMTEEECVAKCKEKVKGFLGDAKAQLFDAIR